MSTTPERAADMTHPYYTLKARVTVARAGGNPDNAAALAQWAEEAVTRDEPPHGVILAEDGQVLAETCRVGGVGASGVYVNDAGTTRYRLRGNEVGLACGQIAHDIGQPVIHVPYSDVCQGAAEFARAEAKRVGA